MKALRSPAALIGIVALAVVLAAIVFIRGSGGGEKGSERAGSAGAIEQVAPSRTTIGMPSEGIAITGAEVSKGEQLTSAQWKSLESLWGQLASNRRLTKEEGERFLRDKGATPMNLLAVATATGDLEFVRRAASLFPDEPAVQLAVLGENLFPEARAEWIARFKASSPENPLPFLFAASSAAEQKDFANALSEASLAMEKPGLYLWSSEFIDASRQMYEWKGYSPLEADLLAGFSRPIDYLTNLNGLGAEFLKWRKQAVEEGNDLGAAEAVRVTYGLGRMFQSPEGSRTVITQLIGIALESRALNTLPPNVQPSFLDIPRAQREAEMQRLKEFIRGAQTDITALMATRDPAMLSSYFQRVRNEGEYQALLWLKEQAK